MRKYNFNEHYFDNIDCQEKAYWLGFFAADGYNHQSKGYIEFRLHNQDREILERFKSSLGATNPIGLYKNTYCNLTLYSNHLCAILSEYGLSQAKTYSLQIPVLNNELMRHFIRGYFDGDGCFSVIKRKDRTEHSLIYQFNITGMEEPLRIMQMHLIDNVGVVDNGLKSRSSTSAVTIHYSGRKVCKRILDYLYKDAVIYLQRKYNKYQEYCISAE
jgi:intein-encoded DNA endonuclease-like protein|nr:MAG: LAGLIDADG DNA endonuclease family protein [Bacteriophage sp.]